MAEQNPFDTMGPGQPEQTDTGISQTPEGADPGIILPESTGVGAEAPTEQPGVVQEGAETSAQRPAVGAYAFELTTGGLAHPAVQAVIRAQSNRPRTQKG